MSVLNYMEQELVRAYFRMHRGEIEDGEVIYLGQNITRHEGKPLLLWITDSARLYIGIVFGQVYVSSVVDQD